MSNQTGNNLSYKELVLLEILRNIDEFYNDEIGDETLNNAYDAYEIEKIEQKENAILNAAYDNYQKI